MSGDDGSGDLFHGGDDVGEAPTKVRGRMGLSFDPASVPYNIPHEI